eukprot:TRINITY_DN60976_c0_g1_i1.p1 TRINITY_DN60976_c0_g1~~TRINITY_DN60976_c0_g1_i1.p1  ORF type:complete len:126 (+),score=11.23 TRINITY_DN60976_c0_g1_i1:121-498(+)
MLRSLVGSEMCIRDRFTTSLVPSQFTVLHTGLFPALKVDGPKNVVNPLCLLLKATLRRPIVPSPIRMLPRKKDPSNLRSLPWRLGKVGPHSATQEQQLLRRHAHHGWLHPRPAPHTLLILSLIHI